MNTSTRPPRSRRRTSTAGLGLILAASLVAPAAALAADNGEWGVQPSPGENAGPAPRTYFFLDGAPGETLSDTVRVVNLTEDPLEFVLHGADAYNTARDGGFALRGVDEEHVDLGAWIDLPVRDISIPPESHADVPFTIDIPEDATPGDHVGGIVALDPRIEEQVDGSGVTIGVARAVGVRMYLRVDGPVIPGLTVRDATLSAPPRFRQRGPMPLEFGIENVGNIQVVPELTATATGLFGRELTTLDPFPVLDLVPGSSSIIATRVGGAWPIDVLSVQITATADDGLISTTRVRTLVISWWPLLLLVLLVGGTVAAVRWRRRQVRRQDEATAASRTPVGVS